MYVFQWQQESDLEKLSEDQLQSEDQLLRKDQLQKERVQARKKLLSDEDSSDLQNITLSQRLMR